LTVPLYGIGGDGTGAGDFLPQDPWLGAAPNPFAPRTQLRFQLSSPGRVSLAIYDVRGRLVRSLVEAESLPAGEHLRSWDGRDEGGAPLASGIYFARLRSGGHALTRKITLLR
jgi:hypothetical protein